MNRFASVRKAVAMPWPGRIINANWDILVSSSASPGEAFLEVIWSRLVQCGYADVGIFGQDLEIEAVNRLLTATFLEDRFVWEYTAYSAKVPDELPPNQGWEPVAISESQYVLLMWLGKNDVLDLDHLPKGCPPSEKILADLEYLGEHGIVGPSIAQPRKWSYLTSECCTVIAPDGRAFAGENTSGRLMRWILDNIAHKPK